jgi:SAM-dependent methyltransferase
VGFDVAAESYDRYMGAWSSQLSGQLADFTGVCPGQRVLDVGCGPGALTAELVARIGPEGVAAVDPSASFVGAARTRHPGVDVREAPAEDLPFPDDAFDAALAQLVVHFMAHPVAGLREMARVTRRTGVIAACVWDFGGGRGPLGPFWKAVRETDSNAVDESNLAGARQGHLVQLFEAAGITQVEEATLVADRTYASFEDWWEPFTRGVGPGGVYVAALDDRRKTELRERCRSMLPAGPIPLTAAALAARGVVQG